MTENERPPGSDTTLRGKRVFVAGHRGMVGSALCRRLERENCEILMADRSIDLRRQDLTEDWFREARPDVVMVAAARVGGILANAERPADFLYDNLTIGANVIHASKTFGVEQLLYLASSCIYPRVTPQPIPESALLTGPLESTNEGYAIAKIACIKLAETYSRQFGCRYMTAMPASLYGPNDNFDPRTAHVIPALMRRIHEAKCEGRKAVDIWGSGRPRREFLHVDDLADACMVLVKSDINATVNVGAGYDLTIAEIAEIIRDVVGYDGSFAYDATKPDGTPQKLMDSSRINQLGWRPKIALRDGLEELYRDFLERIDLPPAGNAMSWRRSILAIEQG